MAADVDATDRWSAFLWRTWGALGVSAWDRRGPAAVVDPEALIVATATTGDLRLVHETIDWGILHAHVLSASRLRYLANKSGAAAEVGTWIATVAARTRTARWGRAEADELTGFTASGASRTYSEVDDVDSRAAAVTLRHRAVVGTTVRGEIVRALHPVVRGAEPAMSTSAIADRAATSAAQASAILAELVAAEVVTQHGTPRRRRFAPRSDHPIARAAWMPWTECVPAPWREAVEVLPALLVLRRPGRPADPASVAAALDVYERASGVLARSGFDVPVPKIVRGSAATVADRLSESASSVLGHLIDRLGGR